MKELAIQKLQDAGLSPSLQRMAILAYLLEHRTHPTVEDVYLGLYRQIPTLSRTTVNNTLKLFAEKGLALSLSIEEKQLHYDGYVHSHAHFRCLSCGKIEDVELTEIPVVNVGARRIKDTQVLLKGLCVHCVEESESKHN